MYRTPLRYPGGKGKISYLLSRIINKTESPCERYIEPFAGGAGVAISLLLEGVVSEIVINDYDLGIYSFWKAILEETDRFIQDLEKIPVTIEEWYRQKEIYNRDYSCYNYELGFATFFLNRTNRSGIIKAGPIGGKAQNGKWRLNARFNKENLIKRISEIANYKSEIIVLNIDVVNEFDQLRPYILDESFVYFDPPYITKGNDLYMNSLTLQDHEKLSGNIKSLSNVSWVVTYDVTEEVEALYSDLPKRRLGINYSLYTKKQADELIIFSTECLIPD